MSRPQLIDGQKVGRWLILGAADDDGRRPRRKAWECLCKCGVRSVVRDDQMRAGRSQSCGCLQLETATKHGHWCNAKPTLTWKSWRAMMNRCKNENSHQYDKYGGRGIKVCERWNDFANFLADMGERPDGMTLDRWPNRHGNYERDNCRWATYKQQTRNRDASRMIEFRGEILTVGEACERVGMNRYRVYKRLDSGWSVEKALLTPVTDYSGRRQSDSAT